MSNLPLHPAVVHLPLGIALAVPLVALASTIALWRGRVPRATWGVVVLLQALVLGGGLLALRTGEADEERVERIVAHDLIEAHEDAGKRFVLAAGAVFVLALGGLVIRREGVTRWLAAGTTVGALVVAGLGLNVGRMGGEMVYVHGAAGAFADPGAAPPAARGEHDDDD